MSNEATAESGSGIASVADVARLAATVLDEIERVVVGKRPALELILCATLARTHVLIEDLPGLGKTLIARCFASALGLDFRRVQFTPDLLPADLTGTTVLEHESGDFAFRRGPVFTNLLLADEINRTPPKTQAALLEAMAEEQVSVDGHTHQLPQPFVVLATDNPIEYEGTYPLPEAQLDRFGMRVRIGYLSSGDEVEMLGRRVRNGSAQTKVGQVLDVQSLLRMREAVELVAVDPDVLDYVVRISAATRQDKDVLVGCSPRASLALLQLARSSAALSGRDYVIPEDVKKLAVPALAHRLSLRPEMWVRRVQSEDVLSRILTSVSAPRSASADSTSTSSGRSRAPRVDSYESSGSKSRS